jgi:hypothetical protein
MSNNYWDEEDDNDDTITGNETESDLQKKLRKKIRADEKRIKELEEKLSGFTVKEREAVVKAVLEKQGVNPKAARLILKDINGDISENAVLDWLDSEGDLVGYSANKDAANDEDREALRRQDTSVMGAEAPDRGRDLETRIANAKSEEELRAILNSQ